MQREYTILRRTCICSVCTRACVSCVLLDGLACQLPLLTLHYASYSVHRTISADGQRHDVSSSLSSLFSTGAVTVFASSSSSLDATDAHRAVGLLAAHCSEEQARRKHQHCCAARLFPPPPPHFICFHGRLPLVRAAFVLCVFVGGRGL